MCQFLIIPNVCLYKDGQDWSLDNRSDVDFKRFVALDVYPLNVYFVPLSLKISHH